MISLLLLVIASILNALMDTLNDHFSTSIFRNLDPKLWNHQISWKFAPTVLGYHIDPWHVAKSTMIACIACAIIFHQPITPIFWCDFLIYGLAWNVLFDVFYQYVFKEK